MRENTDQNNSEYGHFLRSVRDFFIVNKEVNFSSYANDTTLFVTGMSFEKIIPEIENISQWYMNNNLKANVGKVHLVP